MDRMSMQRVPEFFAAPAGVVGRDSLWALARLLACVLLGAVWAALPGCSATSVPVGELERPEPRVVFEREVVAADHPEASAAGLEVLRMGGNAVDAAVATSFALSVVRPESCGIGGGGFMVIALPATAGRPAVETAIDYRERAPAAMTAGTFAEAGASSSRVGGLSVGVPGTVAGLLHAQERYGLLELRDVIAPAIRLAERGWRADRYTRERALWLASQQTGGEEPEDLAGWVLERRAARDLDDPAVWRELLRGGDVFPGTTMRNGEQALALELIAERGRAGFYGGEVARALVSAVRDAGGALTEDDLASFRAKEVEPLEVFALGRRVLTMPPPSTGGVALAQTLLILSAYDDQMRSHVGTGPFDADTPRDPVYLHALVESAKHAFADRARWMGDPEFAALPTRELIDPACAFARANALHPERTLEPALYGSSPEDTARFYELNDAGTSHVSVVDRFGGAVAMTETINLSYGSRVVVPGYGFALNNQMDDFATRPGEPNAFGLVQSELNAPGPGKRPISSMSPTIVLDGAGVVAVAGGSGGPRIISGVTQSLLNVLLFDMEAQDAVTVPRVHHQWLPDVLQVEPGIASDEALVGALVERGHTVEEADRPLGAVQLIRRAQLRDAESGWSAASDGTRKGGEPAGR